MNISALRRSGAVALPNSLPNRDLAEAVQGWTGLLTLDEITDCLRLMAHSFIAYIDEAGDDGLNREKYRVSGRRGGSSHWLTIGATVWRLSRDLDAVRWAKDIRAQLPQQKQRKPLHSRIWTIPSE